MYDFKKSVVYQIYPKSFYDTDGDGIGNLSGVTSKLDYLKNLGIDYIWLTPFFVSPQRDNGYDIADYYNIDPSFGTMDELDEFIKEANKRDIKLMFDMVLNHTSTEHEWFKKALQGDKYYQDFYIWKDGKADGTPPTNWESKFGGNAWEYVPSIGKWYLHLFDVTQADLNWENPNVRKELQKIIRFWIDKGVKAFRFDVINLISKSCYEDDFEGDGRRFYTDGVRVHEYLKELNKATFGTDAEIITVGEMSSTNLENCVKYSGADQDELTMVFSFHHLKVDFVGNQKWVLVPFDFKKLKNILFNWQTEMAKNNAWNALFWCNHDQPRVVSRFGNTSEYWEKSAKMLATVIHLMRGTPYIYQGEEIGMTNADFENINQYRDVESLNYFEILKNQGLSEQSAYQILKVHSRDNSRTPMQWNESENAGFTTGTPWISVNPNYKHISAENQINDENSIFNHYKKLINLRKQYDVIAYGDIIPLEVNHDSVFAYMRKYKNEQVIVINQFYKTEITWKCPIDLSGFECILSNYNDCNIKNNNILRPYESIVLYRKD